MGFHDVHVPHVGFPAGPTETMRADARVEVYTLGGTLIRGGKFKVSSIVSMLMVLTLLTEFCLLIWKAKQLKLTHHQFG